MPMTLTVKALTPPQGAALLAVVQAWRAAAPGSLARTRGVPVSLGKAHPDDATPKALTATLYRLEKLGLLTLRREATRVEVPRAAGGTWVVPVTQIWATPTDLGQYWAGRLCEPAPSV